MTSPNDSLGRNGDAPDMFDDAVLLYERARVHVAELKRVTESKDGLWRIDATCDPISGESIYTLRLNRRALRAIKPIVADAANNLVHALDQVVAAACRIRDSRRNYKVQFPIDGDDKGYNSKASRLANHLPSEWIDLFAALRKKHDFHLPQIQALKTLSNESKHWALVISDAGALGVTWMAEDGHYKVAEIPPAYFADHDAFEFWRGPPIKTKFGFQFAAHFNFVGLSDDFTPSVHSVFEMGSLFVRTVIAEARRLAQPQPMATASAEPDAAGPEPSQE